MLQRFMNLSFGLCPLFQLLHPHFLLRVQPINFRIIQWDEHLLYSPHIRLPILFKTTRHKPPSRVCAYEYMIASTRPIVSSAGGDIVDRSIDRKEEG